MTTSLEIPGNVQQGVTRDFDVPFMISATRWSFVAYSIELAVQAPLLSSQEVTVQLLADNLPTPVTVATAVSLQSGQLAGLGLVSIATHSQLLLLAWVNPNFTIMLTKASGTGTATIVQQTEICFDNIYPPS